MKKFLLFVLALLITIMSMAGCGKDTAKKGEDPTKVPAEPYEISWYIQGTPQDDVNSVELAANEYLKDKINATIKINCLESEQYKRMLTTMMASGVYFDMCFTASWMLEYKNNAINGAFYPLDEYMDTYLADIKSQMEPTVLESARIDGKIYGLPVWKEFSSQYGWIYRKDIADKYNINMSEYKNYKDLEPVLLMLKEKEPDLQYPIDWDSNANPTTLTQVGTLTPVAGVVLTRDNKMYLSPERPGYREACEIANEYYEKGLIKKDVLTATDLMQRAKNGKTFCFLQILKPGKAKEIFQNSDYEWEQVEITPNYMDPMPGRGAMQSISATSKNPDRVARFIGLLNTDKYLKNLIIYGIEGKHYTKISDNIVKVAPNSSYNISGNSWGLGNVYLDYLSEKEDPNKLNNLYEFSKNAEKSDFTLFDFNTAGLESVIASCNVVNKQYATRCSLGAMKPGPIIDEYISRLKAVGADNLKAECEKQYAEYLNNRK